ncbi:segregation/condensation protein A [Candidatus Amoebophilus asiaticus]|nr:segregation/condensation protein A [Candidatus Amoebophilus asiaticus]
MAETSFEIKIPQFEGPFDLLLFFIERDELDIHDIQIAKITNEFLAYIRSMQSLNIELASEFILVAATLMRIKARMLLPRKEFDAEGNEIDPREELIESLIEYKKFKEAGEQMQFLENERFLHQIRGNINKEITKIAKNTSAADELHHLDLYKLLMVFEKVVHRYSSEQQAAPHIVLKYKYTIEDQKERVQKLLSKNKKLSFEKFLLSCKDKIQLIFSFLAILEMLQQKLINIKVGLGYNNFWLSLK